MAEGGYGSGRSTFGPLNGSVQVTGTNTLIEY